MGQTGTCPEAPESLKGEKFYRVFADGFWDLGEFDSVLTGLQVPHLHAFPGVPVAQMLIQWLGLTSVDVAFQSPERRPLQSLRQTTPKLVVNPQTQKPWRESS